jgi:hypothetical protein
VGLLLTGTALGHEARVLTVGVGLAAVGDVSWQGSSREGALTLPRSGESLEIPTLAGVSPGFGLTLEARFFEAFGVELAPYYALTRMSGEATRDGHSFTLSVSQPALHVPVLFKAVVPSHARLVPFLVAGGEYVLPTLADVEVKPAASLGVVAESRPELWFTGGGGVEWNAGLRALDLRIPLSLRGALRLVDREPVTVLPSDAIVLDSSASYQLLLSVGAVVHF